MLLVTTAEMRELDRLTIAGGVPSLTLMERAGEGIVRVIERDYDEGRARGVTVLCGRGNNGGDGFVVARLLADRGWPVRVVLIGDPKSVSADAKANWVRWQDMGGRTDLVAEPSGIGEVAAAIRESGLVVDALLGTGLRADVTGVTAAVIDALAREGGPRPVIAVDLPSGLDGDTGRPHGVAVRASHTITLGYAKIGLLHAPARRYVGRLEVVDIGISPAALAAVGPQAFAATAAWASGLIPRRSAGDHKGSNGHVLVVAGSLGKSGAAVLAARAALRAGAGLVTVAAPAAVLPWIAVALPEAMTDPVGSMAAEVLIDDGGFARRMEGKRAVVIGPGIGRDPATDQLVRSLLASGPSGASVLVVDADGLNALGTDAVPLLAARRGAATVLTPHPGEMARLTGRSIAEVQDDRVAAARDLARASGAVVVLKGAATVIASPEGRVTVNTSGGPLLGVGGTGDVLSGAIGALAAQGLAANDAACLGVFLHGTAGDRLAAALGDAGLLASELADELPATRAALCRAATSV